MALATWTPARDHDDGRLADRTIASLLRSKDGEEISLSDASRRIEQGLPYRVFSELCEKLGLTQAALAELLRLSASTLYRRKAAGRFEPVESDRLWRYVVLYARALEVHESNNAAEEWLHSSVPGLGGATPLAVSKDGPGAQRAMALLGRIEHGVFG